MTQPYCYCYDELWFLIIIIIILYSKNWIFPKYFFTENPSSRGLWDFETVPFNFCLSSYRPEERGQPAQDTHNTCWNTHKHFSTLETQNTNTQPKRCTSWNTFLVSNSPKKHLFKTKITNKLVLPLLKHRHLIWYTATTSKTDTNQSNCQSFFETRNRQHRTFTRHKNGLVKFPNIQDICIVCHNLTKANFSFLP